jgi:hypothetical protein
MAAWIFLLKKQCLRRKRGCWVNFDAQDNITFLKVL